jgi:Mo-co oxidoreductase dimerisation domain
VFRQSPRQENATSTPITEMGVSSLITSHRDGAKISPGKVTLSGIAWDGGYAVSAVQVSTDGGKTWTSATLSQDLGRFTFYPQIFDFTAKKVKNKVMVRGSCELNRSSCRVGRASSWRR